MPECHHCPTAAAIATADANRGADRSTKVAKIQAERIKALETDRDEARAAVREMLRYCEASSGERGDLMGCAIGAETWRRWAKIGGAAMGANKDMSVER